MDISVVICTYNRAEYLRNSINSFVTIEKPENTRYELIIVDNNSTDETEKIALDAIEKNDFCIKYIKEHMQGSNYARNKGIIESSGGIIAFVDDDVIFDKLWMIEMLKTFQYSKNVWGVGGKIIPIFKDGTPPWMSDDLLFIYGRLSFSNSIENMKFPYCPFEGNMAFRKTVFDRFGLFQTKHCRNSKTLITNDGKYFFYMISRIDGKVFFNPHALIYHIIGKERTNKKYILSHNYWRGVSDEIFEQFVSSKPRNILLKDSIEEIKALKNAIFGTYLSPKRIYWRIRKSTFEQWMHHCYRAGVIRQKLSEAFLPKTRVVS